MNRKSLPCDQDEPTARAFDRQQWAALNRRSPLTIAVGRPGAKTFSKIYRVRDAVHDGPGESDPGCRLSYPYAAEYDGRFYVVYSNDAARGANRNSAELAVIPVEALRGD